MSTREIIVNLLDKIPDYKIGYVLAYIQGITAADTEEVETVEPDELDLAMIAEAERVNDGTTVTLDELLKKDGLTYADLQD